MRINPIKTVSVKSNYNVFVGDYPFHQTLQSELLPLLEDHPDEQKRKTNVKATMTNWKWQVDNPKIKRLLLYVEATVKNCYDYKVIGEMAPKMYWGNFWANVYRKGDYTQSHDHYTSVSIFSFVYFLKAKWYDSPLVFTSSGQKIRPKEGRYILFPSHLQHRVPKHRYNDTRITLSGNINDLRAISYYVQGGVAPR